MFSSKTLALVSLLVPFTCAQNYGPPPASSPTPTPAAAAAAASSSSSSSASSSGSSNTQTITAAAASETDFTFTPNSVKAGVGSVVEFHFGALNHSVAESSFTAPCSPSNSSGIFAGFNFATTTGESTSVFQITINDTTPIWFYCPQVSPLFHCPQGMVGVINPPAGKTITQFVTSAMAVNESVVPDVSVQGGVIVKSGSAASSSGSSSGSSSPSSSSTTAAPSSSTTGSASHLVGMGFMGLVGIAFSALLSF